MMSFVAPYTAQSFARAIAMPNLAPPLMTAASCEAYATRIKDALQHSQSASFQPLLTLFLHDDMAPEEIARAKPQADAYGLIYGVKLYPRNATTHSDNGVSDYDKLAPTFAEMEARRLPLLVHGESPEPEVDFYDREATFIDRVLTPIRQKFPQLKIIFEHITARVAIDFVRAFDHTAATITPHHLLYNRNALFEGGLRPHRYCLPPAKREADRLALVQAACSGDAKFFCGTDSAPHATERKVCDHGCAGIFNAPSALATYAEIFEAEDALDQFERFVSINGANFYGAPLNTERLTLVREDWRVDPVLSDGGDISVVPFRADETLTWRVADNET